MAEITAVENIKVNIDVGYEDGVLVVGEASMTKDLASGQIEITVTVQNYNRSIKLEQLVNYFSIQNVDKAFSGAQ